MSDEMVRHLRQKGRDAVERSLDMEEKAKRVLVVVYRLAQGIPGIEINQDLILQECNRLNILGMTESEFDKFHQETVAQFKKGNYN